MYKIPEVYKCLFISYTYIYPFPYGSSNLNAANTVYG